MGPPFYRGLHLYNNINSTKNGARPDRRRDKPHSLFMDLFKLFYNHDQRLDNLNRSNGEVAESDMESTLEDFMNPTPTFSSFYLMGTHFPDEKVGLNQLKKVDRIIECLNQIFSDYHIFSAAGDHSGLDEHIYQMPTGAGIVISDETDNVVHNPFSSEEDSDTDQKNEQLKELLAAGHQVLFKEEAKNGYDLYLYSKENIYPKLFSPLQELVDDSFRFFSVNSKRMRSQKDYYFDLWRLDRPPHGAEEVFQDTVLRSKE